MNRRTERFLQERQVQLQEQAHARLVPSQPPSHHLPGNVLHKQRPKVTVELLNETEKQLLLVRKRTTWMQNAGECTHDRRPRTRPSSLALPHPHHPHSIPVPKNHTVRIPWSSSLVCMFWPLPDLT